MKKFLLAALLAGVSTSAGAVTLYGYDTPDADAFNAGTINGYSYYDGPVLLKTSDGNFLAYCVDLNHELHGQDYTYGNLTEAGNGVSLTEAQSNRIGRIAIAGFAAEGLSTPDGVFAAAAQLAIWSIAYNTTPTFLNESQDPGLTTDFNFLMSATFTDTPKGPWATAFIPNGNWPDDTSLSQEMVIGLQTPVTLSTPEASTWTMALMGFGLVSFAGLYKTRKAPLSLV